MKNKSIKKKSIKKKSIKKKSMKEKELKEFLQRSLRQEAESERMEETIKLCIDIMQESREHPGEERTGFWRYLSDVFRFEGGRIFGLQAAMLCLICIFNGAAAEISQHMPLPVFMPLFAMTVLPVLFRSQFYGMGEIEAVTRASGAQVVLAKLVLAGAANLVCFTILIFSEMYLQRAYETIGQVILYCLVPYLVCMTALLRLMRLGRREKIPLCGAAMAGSGFGWGISARVLPWLYEVSALGVWLAAFIVFGAFFIKEIYFIIEMRKEGKVYGIIC